MATILDVQDLRKSYAGGFEALKGVSLTIEEGEIIALLGPNGAGKTTLISTICGITSPTSGRVVVAGHDIDTDFRAARSMIGLVPQEVALEPFEKVINTVNFSQGLFGKKRDMAAIENILKRLSLWDKRNNAIKELSGGMKRRVLIAKALAHEPRVLFLDEPTAGVDVELRKDMWDIVADLKADGVTIILTTHYIEEAEAIADRVGIIAKGEVLLVEDKAVLMQRMGKKQLEVQLSAPLTRSRPPCPTMTLRCPTEGTRWSIPMTPARNAQGITQLLTDVAAAGLVLRDVATRQSSLEDIFVDSGQGGRGMNWTAIKAIYIFEMARFVRTFVQSLISPVISTSLVFRGVRGGHRQPDRPGGRDQLRGVHRAGADHADGDDPGDFQRVLWHLFPEVHRHDL